MSVLKARPIAWVLIFIFSATVYGIDESFECDAHLRPSYENIFRQYANSDNSVKPQKDHWPWIETDRLLIFRHNNNLILWSKEASKPVGNILYEFDGFSLQLPLVIFDEFQRKGFAFEAKFAVIQSILNEQPHLKKINETIFSSNRASILLHKKLGFKISSSSKSRWSLTRADFNIVQQKNLNDLGYKNSHRDFVEVEYYSFEVSDENVSSELFSETHLNQELISLYNFALTHSQGMSPDSWIYQLAAKINKEPTLMFYKSALVAHDDRGYYILKPLIRVLLKCDFLVTEPIHPTDLKLKNKVSLLFKAAFKNNYPALKLLKLKKVVDAESAPLYHWRKSFFEHFAQRETK